MKEISRKTVLLLCVVLLTIPFIVLGGYLLHSQHKRSLVIKYGQKTFATVVFKRSYLTYDVLLYDKYYRIDINTKKSKIYNVHIGERFYAFIDTSLIDKEKEGLNLHNYIVVTNMSLPPSLQNMDLEKKRIDSMYRPFKVSIKEELARIDSLNRPYLYQQY